MYQSLPSGISLTGNTLVKIKLRIEFGNSKIRAGCIRGLMIRHLVSVKITIRNNLQTFVLGAVKNIIFSN